MKFRAFLVALLMVASSLFVVSNNVTPASAISSCQRGGEYYVNGHYAMIDCFSDGGGGLGNSIRITITCKYILIGVAHTYNVYGNWAAWSYYDPGTSHPGAPGTTGWSTASCGHHVQSGPNNNDWIIHAAPQTSPNPSYWGYPFVF